MRGDFCCASGLMAAINPDRISFSSPKRISLKADTTKVIMPMNPIDITLDSNVIPGGKGFVAQKKDSIGYMHNLLLTDLKSELTPADLSIDSLIIKVPQTACKYYNDEPLNVVIANLSEKRPFFEKIQCMERKGVDTYNDVDDIVNDWKSNFPECSEDLNVLGSFIKGLSNLEVEENDGEYLNKVLELIDASSLDDTKKNELRNAFIVGNASYQLWNTEKE